MNKKAKNITTDTKGNIHVDDAFLEKFIANGGQVQTSQGSSVDDVDKLLEEIGKDHKSSTKAIDKVHNQVEDTTATEEIAISKREQKRIDTAKKQADAITRKQITKAQTVANSVRQATDPLIKSTGRTIDKVSRASTVGGIGLLLAILILLLFIVVEVNNHGDTRIKQIWYMLTGRAQLIGRKLIGKGSSENASQQTNTDQAFTASQNLVADYNKLFQDSTSNPTNILGDTARILSDSNNVIFQTFRSGF